jgi:hypothetical protein
MGKVKRVRRAAIENAQRRTRAPPGNRAQTLALAGLDRDDFSSNRHPALAFCLSMILSENRYPLFGIML